MTAQRKIFKLEVMDEMGEPVNGSEDTPHPFANGKALERQILRVLEQKIAKVEDCAQPIELVCAQVRILTKN